MLVRALVALATLGAAGCNGLPQFVNDRETCERGERGETGLQGERGQRGPAGRNAPMVSATHVEREEDTVAFGTARELYVHCESGVVLSGGCIGDDVVVSVPWQVETNGEIVGWLCTAENRLYEQPSYLAAHVLCTGDEPEFAE